MFTLISSQSHTLWGREDVSFDTGEVMKTKVPFLFVVCSVLLQFLTQAGPLTRKTRKAPSSCSFIVKSKGNKFTVNRLVVSEFVCFDFVDYSCIVPWLRRYCPGNVRSSYCFNATKELSKIKPLKPEINREVPETESIKLNHTTKYADDADFFNDDDDFKFDKYEYLLKSDGK